MYRTTWALLIGIASACGAHTEFTPTERVQGRTVEGFAAAFYDLSTAGTPSEVKVWSGGAMRNPHGDGTLVTIGLTIDNGGREPIELATGQLRLESVQANTSIRADLAPAAIRGNTLVQPQTTSTIEADFAIPSMRPDQIQAFRVKWTARTDGKDYTEFTPFVQRETAAVVPVYGYYYPYAPWDWPFYDPYFYPRARVVIVQPYPRHVVVQGHRH